MPAAGQNGKYEISQFKIRKRDLEHRRAKGEASCAECRRLKLKCDRKVPCISCKRRGCQTICPNGSLAAGHGTRFVLANTDKLHKKLLEMSKRIRQLEDALQIAHASMASTTHPLLSKELLSIKSGVETIAENERPGNEDDDPASELSRSFGTLAISERGEARFVGRVSSEALLMVINDATVDQLCRDRLTDGLNDLPEQITSVSKAFPFAPAYLPKEEILNLIEARLPSYARATALAEAYLGNVAWFCRIVQREQIMEELIPSVYKPFSAQPNSVSIEEDVSCSDRAQRLPLLLGVLACGAAGDLTLPLNNDEAELYIHLARAAQSLNPVFMGASIETVQTTLMLAAYDFCSCRKHSLESAWKMISFGLTLAASIGLHRDPARWKLGPKYVERRRFLFWEIFAVDKWKSLESGRPAIFNLQEVDCEFPQDKESRIAEDGTIVPSFWRWKHRFTKEVTASIAEQLCLVRPIKYTEILELDRKIRDFEAHPSMLKTFFDLDNDLDMSLQRYMWGLFREIALLFIHRNFFARAMLEHPMKPLSSPFVSSLLSAYASAITLLNVVRAYFDKYSPLLLRQWIVWTHALTAGVVIGSVAVRGQTSAVARMALKELEQAVELFEQAKMHPVARSGLPILLRLCEKARCAKKFSRPRDFPNPNLASSTLLYSPANRAENADEELEILGGTARFVKSHSNQGSPCSAGAPSPPETKPGHSDTPPTHSTRSTPPFSERSSAPSSGWQHVGNSQPATLPNDAAWLAFQQPQLTATILAAGLGLDSAFYGGGECVAASSDCFHHDTDPHTMTGAFGSPAAAGSPGMHDGAAHIPGAQMDASSSSDVHPGSQVRAHERTLSHGSPVPGLGSTSWLEGLSGSYPGDLAYWMDVDGAGAEFDFLSGGESLDADGLFRYQAEGGEPSIADAWRSIMADPQLVDSVGNVDFSLQ